MFQPILIQIISRLGSWAYLKSLWQRCHSLLVQARCAKPPLSVLTEVSLSSADHRSGKCRFPFSPLFDRYIPDSEDAYDPVGGGCDLLVWIVTATGASAPSRCLFEVLLILISRYRQGRICPYTLYRFQKGKS